MGAGSFKDHEPLGVAPTAEVAAPEYVAARRVLLDALKALAAHRDAVVVAGAQAVYLRTGPARLAVAAYTTDGDLAVDPRRLAERPALGDAMRAAGFEPAPSEPGVCVARAVVAGEERRITVDLIVPDAFADTQGRRGARLGPHGKTAARKVVGLEACLLDHGPLLIEALDPSDTRSLTAEVAGPSGLLVAKIHKIKDRLTGAGTHPGRLVDKDAGDVMRLMQATPVPKAAATLRLLAADDHAGPVTQEALEHLTRLFGRAGSQGTQMAVRSFSLAMPAGRVAAVCTTWTARLGELLLG
jgi:hypothetical protein